MNMVLNDVCEVYSGYALKSFNEGKEGFPVIKIGNILTDGRLSLEDCQYTTETVNTKYYSQKDDVYVALSGATTGKIGLMETDESYVINQRVGVVRRKDKKIPSRFIKYFLLKQTERILQEAAGCAQPNISPKQIGAYTFPSFSSEKMEEITRELDKVTNVIQYRYKQNNLLDCLIKARFVEMFGDPEMNPYGWQKINISNIVQGKVSNGYFAKRDEYVEDGNAAILGVAYIVNRIYSGIEGLPRTNVTLADIQKYKVRYGDMLFCRSSLVAEGIGKASIVPENVPDNTLFECHVIRLPLDMDKCVPEFMQVLSTTDYFRKQMIAQSKTATMTTIGQDGIKKANIILPPIEKQREFYSFVKQIDKSKVVVPSKIKNAIFVIMLSVSFGQITSI